MSWFFRWKISIFNIFTCDKQHQVADIFEDDKFCVQLSVVWAGSKWLDINFSPQPNTGDIWTSVTQITFRMNQIINQAGAEPNPHRYSAKYYSGFWSYKVMRQLGIFWDLTNYMFIKLQSRGMMCWKIRQAKSQSAATNLPKIGNFRLFSFWVKFRLKLQTNINLGSAWNCCNELNYKGGLHQSSSPRSDLRQHEP